jgi:hypothetical protein
MAKKLTKIRVKDDKYKPSLDNKVIFYYSDLIIKTCDIYRFNLTDKQKVGNIILRTGYNLERDEDLDKLDFYLLRVKEEFVKDLEEKIINFSYGCPNSDSNGKLENLDDFSKPLEEMFSDLFYDAEFLFKRRNNRDYVVFIPYFSFDV